MEDNGLIIFWDADDVTRIVFVVFAVVIKFERIDDKLWWDEDGFAVFLCREPF